MEQNKISETDAHIPSQLTYQKMPAVQVRKNGVFSNWC